MQNHLPLLSDLSIDMLRGKCVLLRGDINVPIARSVVSDDRRIRELMPTIAFLINAGAKIIIMSHFGRPKSFEIEYSLAPLVDVVSKLASEYMKREIIVDFSVDAIGAGACKALAGSPHENILLLENLRFYSGELQNDQIFAQSLASLADIYVNDAFSCCHRSHASIDAITEFLPSFAGLLLDKELENLSRIFGVSHGKNIAIIGGAKISTKLDLLNHLIDKMNCIFLGGGMANSFFAAKGYNVGRSLCEPDLLEAARKILQNAKERGCEIILPQDLVVAADLNAEESRIVAIDDVLDNEMILDVGPASLVNLSFIIKSMNCLVWNGPIGAFEFPPFDIGSLTLARIIAAATYSSGLISVAGGGDVVAAIKNSKLTLNFSYISTAGGAFLEWLEGKDLPGIAALKRRCN